MIFRHFPVTSSARLLYLEDSPEKDHNDRKDVTGKLWQTNHERQAMTSQSGQTGRDRTVMLGKPWQGSHDVNAVAQQQW